ncbi:secreted RxLR effector protein 161-like [Juglans microcarpa x Juglans regia]|uniref:secreted RxLR effector protein 161-like n=1 Tax=Juglans microcarpa x Juglans regia TaxID=2249226 RepID=UPI001B7E380E|nr:secreted RxLR effector protein 161-like [Juglans microcarpa x Juglans regia]
MKYLREVSFVLGIEICRDRARSLMGLSQKAYIRHVLQMFEMQKCALGVVPIIKEDKFNKTQCPRNELERESGKNIPYASVVGSLMYAQVCTRLDIAYAISVLSRFQLNPRQEHWKAAKKVMRYLKKTEGNMLTFQRSNHLEVVGYLDSDFAGCQDDLKSTSGLLCELNLWHVMELLSKLLFKELYF